MTLFVTRLAELPVGARSFLYASDGLKMIKKWFQQWDQEVIHTENTLINNARLLQLIFYLKYDDYLHL